jgi:hypothetical protein
MIFEFVAKIDADLRNGVQEFVAKERPIPGPRAASGKA